MEVSLYVWGLRPYQTVYMNEVICGLFLCSWGSGQHCKLLTLRGYRHQLGQLPQLEMLHVCWQTSLLGKFSNFLKNLFLFIFRQRGREGEREGKKHRLVASRTSPTEDLACNPGMCPDWESNCQPFSLQAGSHSTERQQSRQQQFFF